MTDTNQDGPTPLPLDEIRERSGGIPDVRRLLDGYAALQERLEAAERARADDRARLEEQISQAWRSIARAALARIEHEHACDSSDMDEGGRIRCVECPEYVAVQR